MPGTSKGETCAPCPLYSRPMGLRWEWKTDCGALDGGNRIGRPVRGLCRRGGVPGVLWANPRQPRHPRHVGLILLPVICILALGLGAPSLSLGTTADGVALVSTAQAASSRATAPLVVVSWPGAERERWIETDGVPGRRGINRWLRQGWILRPDELSTEERTRLDAWIARAGDDLLWIGEEAGRGASASDRGGVADPDGDAGLSVRRGLLPLGSGEGAILLHWEGVGARDHLDHLARESHAWLEGNRRLRWEEAAEILDLSSRENRAFQVLHDPANPFFLMRSTFVADKSAANLCIYLLGTRQPPALAWRMGLVRAFENGPAALARGVLSTIPPDVLNPGVPKVSPGSLGAERLEQARSRLFCGRVLASRGRVYGRCDRILVSLAVEGKRGTLLVVDARDSADPFVAVLRVGDSLPPSDRRGELLVEALRIRWPASPGVPPSAVALP